MNALIGGRQEEEQETAARHEVMTMYSRTGWAFCACGEDTEIRLPANSERKDSSSQRATARQKDALMQAQRK